MQDKPKAIVRITDFPGLASNIDPHDVKEGCAVTQSNIMSLAPGRLTVRRGYQRTSFVNAGTATASSSTILAASDFMHPLGSWVVYENSNGHIRAGMNPT